MADDLVAELTLQIQNEMSDGVGEIRGDFSDLNETLGGLRDVLGELTGALAGLTAPVGLVDGMQGVVTETDQAVTAVQQLGVVIDEDAAKLEALRSAWIDGPGTFLPPAPTDEGGADRPSFIPPGTPPPSEPTDPIPLPEPVPRPADEDGPDLMHRSGHGKGGDAAMGLLFAGMEVATGREAAQSYADFDWILTHITITEKLNGDAAETEKARLTSLLDNLALSTGNSSTDLADAYSFLVTTGMSKDLIGQLMPSLAETATAYNVPVADQAQSVFTLNNVMGIAPDDMQQGLAVLAYAAKLGHFTVADFGANLPGIGAQMSMLGAGGLHGEDTAAAALETVRRVTGTSDEAATDVSDLLTYMTSPMATRFFDRTQRSKDLLGQPILNLLAKYHVRPLDAPAYLDSEEEKGVDPLSAMVDYMSSLVTPKMTPTDEAYIFGSILHNQQAAMAMRGLVENKQQFEDDKSILFGVTPQTVTTDYHTASAAPQFQLNVADEQFAELTRTLGKDVIPTMMALGGAADIALKALNTIGGLWTNDAVPYLAHNINNPVPMQPGEQNWFDNLRYRGHAPPTEIHLIVKGDGTVTHVPGGTTQPGVNVSVNQGQVLGTH